ncbi:Uncharacterised protein [Mycobacteroides abscessus subsp. abscessus]|nr:Uncharacterised protein [Mycobacteroides abscessus subsp. abscessus]
MEFSCSLGLYSCVANVTGVTIYRDVSGRCPINAVPTRTHVDPYLMAASRSLDIPADKRFACG